MSTDGPTPPASKLLDGTDPKNILPEAKTIIVLIDVYFKESFPPVMESHFGRCYLDDDRVTKDGLARRISAFRGFLRDNGIESKVSYNLPHRAAAARAGLGHIGEELPVLIPDRQPGRVRGTSPLSSWWIMSLHPMTRLSKWGVRTGAAMPVLPLAPRVL